MHIYPNPVQGALTISLPQNAPVASIQVSDLRGVVVRDVRLQADGQVDVSALPAGIYLLRVSDGQQTYHQRFVKE
jgi:bacillolysin